MVVTFRNLIVKRGFEQKKKKLSFLFNLLSTRFPHFLLI